MRLNTSHIADMEYHCNKDAGIATKIYELGLKAFPDDVAFATKFLEFQIRINDESSMSPLPHTYHRLNADETTMVTDARALFERLVIKFSADKARPLWDIWCKYENLYGDLAASQKLEARMKEAYPNGMLLDLLSTNGLADQLSNDRRTASPLRCQIPLQRHRPNRQSRSRFRYQARSSPPTSTPVGQTLPSRRITRKISSNPGT